MSYDIRGDKIRTGSFWGESSLFIRHAGMPNRPWGMSQERPDSSDYCLELSRPMHRRSLLAPCQERLSWCSYGLYRFQKLERLSLLAGLPGGRGVLSCKCLRTKMTNTTTKRKLVLWYAFQGRLIDQSVWSSRPPKKASRRRRRRTISSSAWMMKDASLAGSDYINSTARSMFVIRCWDWAACVGGPGSDLHEQLFSVINMPIRTCQIICKSRWGKVNPSS